MFNITIVSVPTGCGQYYTESTGTIKGFNADAAAEITRYYLADLTYTICVRRNANKCSVNYCFFLFI